MVGVKAVGVAARVVLFEEVLGLGLSGEIGAVAIAKCQGGLGGRSEGEQRNS